MTPAENEISLTLAGLSQTNQNDLLVDSSRLLALSVEEAEEVEAAEEEAVAVAVAEEGVTIPTTTLTPSPPRLQMGNSTGRNQQYSQEIGR